MNHSIWASVIEQYYKALSQVREVDGWIGEAVEQHRKSEVVIVSAAAMVTFMAFTFFVLHTINAVAGSDTNFWSIKVISNATRPALLGLKQCQKDCGA